MYTREPNDLTTIDRQTFERLVQDSHRLQALLDQQARAREDLMRARGEHLVTAIFITRDGLTAFDYIRWQDFKHRLPVFERAARPPRGSLEKVMDAPSDVPAPDYAVRRYSFDGYREFDGRCIPVYRED